MKEKMSTQAISCNKQAIKASNIYFIPNVHYREGLLIGKTIETNKRKRPC
jgi:hypothetical protein